MFIGSLLKIKQAGMVITVAGLVLISSPVSAGLYSDRDAVDNKLKQQKAELNHLHGQVTTLQSQLSALDQSIRELNAQINQNSAAIAETEQQIKKSEAELAIHKAQMGELIRISYQQSQTSPLEILVGSKNLSEFVDKQQYINVARQKVTETAKRITQLKNELDAKKKTLEAAKLSLESNKQAVAAERAKQNELLAATRGQEAEFRSLVEKTKAQKASLDSQIAALSRAQSSGGRIGAASGPVKRGQVIGAEGTTGNSTGCHLHFTVYQNGREVNPANLISSGALGKPLAYGPGNISQGFGPATWSNPYYSFHNGIDISTGCGSPIFAAADGNIVKNVRNDGSGYGHYIVINHNNGLVTLYAHMQ